jgi:hypothetical protein
MLLTEYAFTLPKGFIDSDGNLHREGVMRLANTKDEIAPLQDPRVQRNRAYIVVIIMSRVITKLGELSDINPGVIENLFSTDLAYLQDLYRRINSNGHALIKLTCPLCENDFEVTEEELNGGAAPEG